MAAVFARDVLCGFSQICQWRDQVLAGGYDLVVLAARWAHLFEAPHYGELTKVK